jgi:uncharacterized protein (TIGR02145 family)
MKKFTLCLLVLVYSCSTTNDGNTTSTTLVPLQPTNLIGNVPSATQINLSWTDNSTNETGFKIERKKGTETYAVIGTTATDVTIFNDIEFAPNTTYTYRVYSYNSGGNSPTYSNEISLTTTAILPTVTTTSASAITTKSSTSGGAIIADGGATVIARGVCWSTSPNPTITLTTKTTDGTGVSSFTSSLTGLSSGTTYYVRAYATNSKGVGYGDNISFTTTLLYSNGNGLTDICGNNYPSIIIGQQEWMKKNLDVCKYRNGDVIPQVQDPSQWASLTTGAWCYYQNNTANGSIYGKLYNYYAVNDTRGLSPLGWHIPTDSEWTTLVTKLGGQPLAGGKLKETGTSHWNSPNSEATNESGFSALPGGIRNEIFGNLTNGFFEYLSNDGFWWSKPSNPQGSFHCSYNSAYVGFTDGIFEKSGLSVRCIKD